MSYIFSKSQISVFKDQAHSIRNTLKLFDKAHVPSVTAMLDIWARCLEYKDYQLFIRQSSGHQATTIEPVVLTQDTFTILSDTLFQQLQPSFSLPKCCWAIAGLFNLDDKKPLEEEDIALLKTLMLRIAPPPVDERKQRLIDLGCLVVEKRTFENAPELGPIVVGYHVTELGKYAAARELERHKGRALSHEELIRLGLPEELCRLRMISVSVTSSWKDAQPVGR
jgi:hypothetical protein